MATGSIFPLQIFYDGSCSVCRREMQTYQRCETDARLIFIDISTPAFQATDHGRSREDFMRELHVRDASGEFHTGLAAFARIWSAFPESPTYSLLERGLKIPGIRQLADLGYATLARSRHLLPKSSGRLH